MSVYPVLSLIAFNISELDPSEVWRALILAFLGGVILWLLIQAILKNWAKSAIFTSMILAFFFSYGHIYLSIKELRLGELLIGRHRFLLPLMTALFVIGVIWVIKIKISVKVNETLNWIALFLVVYPIFQITTYELSSLIDLRGSKATSINPDFGKQNLSNELKHDIYYIILDAYGRADTLHELYGYDNGPFIDSLRNLGFYIAECSQSNYPETKISLASGLNMGYEQDIWDRGNYDKKRFNKLVLNSRIRQILEEQGYKIVAFNSGHIWSEMTDADVYLSPEDISTSWLNQNLSFGAINNFETQLLETTLVNGVNDIELLSRRFNIHKTGYLRRRTEVLYVLDTLSKVSSIPGPKYVFAHIVSPHRPFVFGTGGEEILDADGKLTFEEDYATGYTNQVSHLNLRMIPILEEIIQSSEISPIIIIQGDHGPAFTTPSYRSTILNVYYLPDGGDDLLYPTISPVNTFRVILNHYFGTNLELLEDIHYQSAAEARPEEYQVIPNVGPFCGVR